MVGMSLTKTRGGISTLIAEMLKSSLADDFDFDYIESQAEDFRGLAKLTLAMRAMLAFVFKTITNRPDLVYVHVGSNASLYRESLFILAARLLMIPTIGHFHAGDVDEYLGRQPLPGTRFITRALAKSNLLIAVSQASATKLRRLVPDAEIAVIVNAIDTRPFAALERDETRETVNVLFVGAMGKLKGEKDLVDAVRMIGARHPNLRVSFLGFGEDELARYAVDQGIAAHVAFVGPVAPEKRLGYFADADIFVLPTYAEAMPMSVIEAMAAGLPIVSTRVGGIPELVEEGREGYLCEPGETGIMAVNLSRLVGNATLRRKMGEAANEKVGKTLDFNVYTKKLRNAMLSVSGGKAFEDSPRKEIAQL